MMKNNFEIFLRSCSDYENVSNFLLGGRVMEHITLKETHNQPMAMIDNDCTIFVDADSKNKEIMMKVYHKNSYKLQKAFNIDNPTVEGYGRCAKKIFSYIEKDLNLDKIKN